MIQKTAFVFPGQGSQSIGMLSNLAKRHIIVGQTFEEASEILGYDLWRLIQEGPKDQLDHTEFTQPAVLVASIAIWRVWQELHGFKPDIMAGHSLGEYAALTCAGALELSEAVFLVAKRARLMQNAVRAGEGAMAAIIGLKHEKVEDICKEAGYGQIVQPANFNSAEQIVIAGIKSSVDKAIKIAKDKGAKKVVVLPVSVPAHCVLMQPIVEEFMEFLGTINWKKPVIPVVHNFDVKTCQDQELICNALAKQLDHPVRWFETVTYMVSIGVKLIIECGPGKVLTGLNKRIDRNLTCIAIEDPEALERVLHESLEHA